MKTTMGEDNELTIEVDENLQVASEAYMKKVPPHLDDEARMWIANAFAVAWKVRGEIEATPF